MRPHPTTFSLSRSLDGRRPAARGLLLCRGVRIDHVAGLVLRRPEDWLPAAVGELLDVARRHVLELGEYHPRLCPFAVLGEGEFAGNRRETVRVHVVGEHILIQAFGGFDRLRKNLTSGVAERHEAMAERIDFFAGRGDTIALEHVGEPGEVSAPGRSSP